MVPEVSRVVNDAKLRPVHLSEFLERGGVVLFRIQGERIHEQVFTHSILQRPVNLNQLLRDQWTGARAVGVHEVEYRLLAMDQVVVKLDLFVFMGEKNAVREPPHPVWQVWPLVRRPPVCEIDKQVSSIHRVMSYSVRNPQSATPSTCGNRICPFCEHPTRRGC